MAFQSVNVNFIAVGCENMERVWKSLITTFGSKLF